jgi:hypothetical protein
MPNRLIREGIITSRAVNSLSVDAELLYRRLMSVVDDYGRFEADPDILRARCFPLQLDQWPVVRINEALSSVSTTRTGDGHGVLVTLYGLGHHKYLQINNFRQRVRSDSKYPDPAKCQPCDRHEPDISQTSAAPARGRSESESESESVDRSTTARPNGHPTAAEIIDIRGWLAEYVKETHRWEPPDDEIVTKVIGAAGGDLPGLRATLKQMHDARLKPERSYGWFVKAVRQRMGARVA